MRRLPSAGRSPWPPSPSSARRRSAAPPPAAATSEAAGGSSGPVTLRLGLLPEHHPRPGGGRRGEGHLRREARRQRQAGDQDLQRRPGRHRGALLRRARRHLHRSEPDHQRLLQVQGRGGPGRSPAPPPAASPWSSSPSITTARRTCKGKKIATPQLGNTQDVALRYWLKEKGLTTTKEGGGDVKIVPQENAQTVETFTQRRDRRRLGARAVRLAAWSTPAARCWSTSATCGRTASSSSPT